MRTSAINYGSARKIISLEYIGSIKERNLTCKKMRVGVPVFAYVCVCVCVCVYVCVPLCVCEKEIVIVSLCEYKSIHVLGFLFTSRTAGICMYMEHF